MPYVRSVLKEPIDEIIVDDKYCEVNPFFMDKNTVAKRSFQILEDYTIRVINSILSSAKQCPPLVRQICADLRLCATKCFPNDPIVKYSAVSAFLFTRLFCPGKLVNTKERKIRKKK